MGSIKPHSYTGRGSLLDDSFVVNREAWRELGKKTHGANIKYDICVHKGKEPAFRSDVNDRIKDEIIEEQASTWWLIHESLGSVILPSRSAVSVKKPFSYKPQ